MNIEEQLATTSTQLLVSDQPQQAGQNVTTKTTVNLEDPANDSLSINLPRSLKQADESITTPKHSKDTEQISGPIATSDLAKLAITHLDVHLWQKPLLEIDQRFHDKTYYKHYTNRYISSLRSKLGHFLADSQELSRPVKHLVHKELDNYARHRKMCEMLTDYYQSLGSSFFSFATPSPDEEIAIGCRLGTKGFYPFQVHQRLEIADLPPLLLLLLRLSSD